MAFFEGGAKDSEQVPIGVINRAPPFTRQRVDLNVEIESAHGEKTSRCRSPKLTGGLINSIWKVTSIWRVALVIVYLRKTNEESVLISGDRARAESVQKSESPTLEDLLRLSCGLQVGLDILTAIYFRKARDKQFLNSNELSTFFFKQCTIFFLITSPSLNKLDAFL